MSELEVYRTVINGKHCLLIPSGQLKEDDVLTVEFRRDGREILMKGWVK